MPERLYTQILPTDHVDVFSGALVLSQPLWSAPQQGDLTLSLVMHHSSTAGDSRMWGGQALDTSEDPGTAYRPPHEVNRVMTSWAGASFELSLGRIAMAPVHDGHFAWHYVDETGAMHELVPIADFEAERPPGAPSLGPPPPPLPPSGCCSVIDDSCCPPDPVSPPGVAHVTTDGTYLRADYFEADDLWYVRYGDGTFAELGHRVNPARPAEGELTLAEHDDAHRGGGYWLTRKFDAHGNVIAVTYAAPPAVPGAIASIVDSVGRVVTFDVRPDVPGDARSGHLAAMHAPAFGGAIATTTFDHSPFRLFECFDAGPPHCGLTGRCTAERWIARLVSITRQVDTFGAPLVTSFTYRTRGDEAPSQYSDCVPAWNVSCGLTPVSWWLVIASVAYPTGGRVAYTYGGWLWEMDVDPPGPGLPERTYAPGRGIVKVRKFVDGDEANTSASNVLTWVYRRGCEREPMCMLSGNPYECWPDMPCPAGGAWSDSCWGVVDVVQPDGNLTRHRFFLDELDRASPRPSAMSGKELERWAFESDCGPGQVDYSCSGDDPCDPMLVRRVVTSWMEDDLGVRESGSTTWMLEEHDATTASDDTWARTTVSRCGFDGFGRFERETTTSTGSLAHVPRTSVTDTTPDPEGWIFGSWVTAADQEGVVRVQARARFDAIGRQVLALGEVEPELASAALECPLSGSAATPPPGDELELAGVSDYLGDVLSGSHWQAVSDASRAAQAAPVAADAGDLVTCLAYGATEQPTSLAACDDAMSPAPPSGCEAWAPPATTDEIGRLRRVKRYLQGDATSARADLFTWKHGALESRRRCGLDPHWYGFRRKVDASTGLTSINFDTANRPTFFAFDLLGRLTYAEPQDDAATRYEYPTPRRVTVTLAGSAGASVEHHDFDGLGRQVSTRRTLDDGRLAFKRFEYDASGRRVRESRWQEAGTFDPDAALPMPPPESWATTSYAFASPRTGTVIEDALGRVRRVVNGPGSELESEYPLAGGVLQLRRGLNGDPSAVSSSLAVSDGLGRLVRVEPQQAGGAAATYSYDVFGELSGADLTAAEPDGPTFTQHRAFIRDGLARVRLTSTPEGGTVTTLRFDADGNALELQDEQGAASGYTLVTERDVAGRETRRLKRQGATDEVLAELSYDGVGSGCPGTHDLGKMTGETVPLPGFGGTYERCVQYAGRGGRRSKTRVSLDLPAQGSWFWEDETTWNDRGMLASHAHPTAGFCWGVGDCGYIAGDAMRHEYSRGFATDSAFDGVPATTTHVVQRAANGTALRVAFGNGTRRTVELDALERTSRISVTGPGATTLWDSGTYRYDGLNQIIGIGDSPAPVAGTHPQSFEYDAHLRLARARMPDISTDIAYRYDGFGNLTTRLGTTWPVAPQDGGFANRRHYVGSVHDNRIHDPGFTWSANGNLLTSPAPARAYTWDAQDRLTTVFGPALSVLGRYAYDAAGERILGDEGGQLRFFARGGAAAVTAEYAWDPLTSRWEPAKQYLSSPDGALGYVARGATAEVTIFGSDHLGTPRVLANGAGAAQSVHEYEPYGLEPPGSPSSSNTHRFTGHERDPATGLDYMHARYFDARLGRFLGADTGQDATLTLPASLNRMSYCIGNPPRLLDPDGRSWLVFDGDARQISLYMSDGTRVGRWYARNNVAIDPAWRKVKGQWPDGTYAMLDRSRPNRHPGAMEKDGKTPKDSTNGAYGPYGIFRAQPFGQPETSELSAGRGVHSGRASGKGPDAKTQGCIRTTDVAMETITGIASIDPLKSLVVQNNCAPADAPTAATREASPDPDNDEDESAGRGEFGGFGPADALVLVDGMRLAP